MESCFQEEYFWTGKKVQKVTIILATVPSTLELLEKMHLIDDYFFFWVGIT